MKLKKILGSVTEKVGNIRISGISLNSKKIKKGNVFFSIKGKKTSGKKFIKDIIAKKASCVITDENIDKKNYKIPIIKVKNCRKSLSEASSNIYSLKPKNIIAVTGTNGKSSVANFFFQILTLNKKISASMGTLGINSKEFKKKTKLTSSDPITLHKNLFQLAKKKNK